MQTTNTMLMIFSEYLEQFETDDAYTDLMVTLFERKDLIIKTNEMKHLAGMVKHFQNEISHLQEYMFARIVRRNGGWWTPSIIKETICMM